MSKIRGKNTKPEVALCKLVSSRFYPLGFRYRKNARNLPGKPDIAFQTGKVAVFVDGGFWHGYKFKRWENKLDVDYWLPKIRENMKRDRSVNRKLKDMGWKVIRVWAHEVQKNPAGVLERIHAALRGK